MSHPHDELQGHDPAAEEAIAAGPKPKAHVAKPVEEKAKTKKAAAKKPVKKAAAVKSTVVSEPVTASHPITSGWSVGNNPSS